MHICMDCQNGFANKCKWVAFGIEVEGIKKSKRTGRIIFCPNFVKDEKKERQYIEDGQLQKRRCPECDTLFTPRRKQQRYCSKKCSTRKNSRIYREKQKRGGMLS